MATPSSSSPPLEIQLRSSIPGRERWEADCIRGRPERCRVIVHDLGARADIHEVRANPWTGRVLVSFDSPSLPEGTATLLRLALSRSLEAPKPKPEPPSLRSLWKNPVYRALERVDTHRSLTLKAPALSVLAVFANVLSSWILSKMLALDNDEPIHSTSTGSTGRIWGIGLVGTLAYLTEAVLGHYQESSWRQIATTTEHRLRSETFAKAVTLDLEYFDERNSTAILQTIQYDSASVGQFLGNGPRTLLQQVASSVLVTLAILVQSPLLLPVALVPFGIASLTARYFQRSVRPLEERERALSRRLTQTVGSALEGISTVKSFAAEDAEIARVERQSREAILAADQASRAGLAFTSRMRAITSVANLLTLTLAGNAVLRGSVGRSGFVFIMTVLPKLTGSISSFAAFFRSYNRAAESSERLLEILDARPRIVSGPMALAPQEVAGDIRFNDTSFSYSTERPVLRNLALATSPGEMIGIAGPSGAGKSTLVKLLLRFYEPQGGETMLDGHQLQELQLDDLRRAIGYVSQDYHLFAGTVAENITYGSPHASRDEMIDAATAAAAHEFIIRLPEGYETQVGEGGKNLSTGQRQRIAIARALTRRSPILVLDEATAAVDNETEEALQRSLERAASGRSMIVIAHRLSTIRNSNRIYVIDQGTVREQGTHDELVQLDGLYARLWRVQTGIRTRSEDY